MAGVKTHFKLLTFFGRIPETAQIEKEEETLRAELEWLNEQENSEFIQSYFQLEKKVTSDEFTKKLEAIKADTFDKTKEYKLYKEYEELKKSRPIKKFFKYQDTGKPGQIEQFEESAKLKRYKELNTLVNSGKFETKKSELENLKKYEGSEEQKQFEEFQTLKKDAELKSYFKLKNSSRYKAYSETLSSKELSRYNELEEFVNSEEFKKVKAEKEDSERYKQTEEYKELENYNNLKASDDIKKYLVLKDSDKFDELKSWDLTFYDDFDSGKLDEEKWLTSYYWGKALLNEPYSLASDLHFPTDGKNLEIKNSVLTIRTRKEKYKGKVWDPKVGIYEKDFDYTSGLISTGGSFRQKQGRFEAKVKINSISPVTSAFWMVSDQMLPHIDVVKSGDRSKLLMGNHWGPQLRSSIARFNSKFANDFYIFTIDWNENSITWKINGKVVRETTEGIPDSAMYLIFSSGLYSEFTGDCNDSFEVDWVKCYKKK